MVPLCEYNTYIITFNSANRIPKPALPLKENLFYLYVKIDQIKSLHQMSINQHKNFKKGLVNVCTKIFWDP